MKRSTENGTATIRLPNTHFSRRETRAADHGVRHKKLVMFPTPKRLIPWAARIAWEVREKEYHHLLQKGSLRCRWDNKKRDIASATQRGRVERCCGYEQTNDSKLLMRIKTQHQRHWEDQGHTTPSARRWIDEINNDGYVSF
jgi:hypothetical protein